jgi:hypothetical protein
VVPPVRRGDLEPDGLAATPDVEAPGVGDDGDQQQTSPVLAARVGHFERGPIGAGVVHFDAHLPGIRRDAQGRAADRVLHDVVHQLGAEELDHVVDASEISGLEDVVHEGPSLATGTDARCEVGFEGEHGASSDEGLLRHEELPGWVSAQTAARVASAPARRRERPPASGTGAGGRTDCLSAGQSRWSLSVTLSTAFSALSLRSPIASFVLPAA